MPEKLITHGAAIDGRADAVMVRGLLSVRRCDRTKAGLSRCVESMDECDGKQRSEVGPPDDEPDPRSIGVNGTGNGILTMGGAMI